MTNTALAFVLFIAWTLALLILMEAMRSWLVVTGKVPSNGFRPDNENLSPFLQRLARAHLNCIEGLPVFGGLMIAALLTAKTGITDPLALWLVAARVAQSTIHLASTGAMAVNARFTAFAVQMAIAVVWTWQLVGQLLAASM
jgi:uncharacterized MAPEG superfamily protein